MLSHEEAEGKEFQTQLLHSWEMCPYWNLGTYSNVTEMTQVIVRFGHT